MRIFLGLFFCFLCRSSFLLSYEYELGITAIFQNEAPYLKEWIDYHQLLGVQHFWLYNDSSTDNWEEVVRPYIQLGVVELIDWSEERKKIQKWPKIQIEAYKDAIVRAKGASKWLALIDVDEFILPMQEKNIKTCLDKHFSDAQAVYISWLVFGTSGKILKEGESMLDALTHCSFISHSWNNIGKSIVQPEKVLIEDVWTVHHFPVKESCIYVNGSGKKMDRVNKLDLFATQHNAKYIRINHYFFRDEKFYRDVKIARKLERNMSIEELSFLYDICTKSQDQKIKRLLRSIQ